MAASVTDNMVVFRTILQIIALLHERYQQEAMTELGAFIDFIFLPYLDNPYCATVQKVAIIEVLLLSLLKSASSVIHLYYNYDKLSTRVACLRTNVTTLKRLIAPDEPTRTSTPSALKSPSG